MAKNTGGNVAELAGLKNGSITMMSRQDALAVAESF